MYERQSRLRRCKHAYVLRTRRYSLPDGSARLHGVRSFVIVQTKARFSQLFADCDGFRVIIHGLPNVPINFVTIVGDTRTIISCGLHTRVKCHWQSIEDLRETIQLVPFKRWSHFCDSLDICVNNIYIILWFFRA